MPVIGLYDIDLWHQGTARPSLELMKTYNFYRKKGDIVNLMKPLEKEGRYSKIIYFKDNPNIQIPKTVEILGDKKEIYGYGFYNKLIPLPQEIHIMPPDYRIYDLIAYKLHPPMKYDTMKNHSLIRLENEDFSDYKANSNKIIFVDNDFISLPVAYDFLIEHKNKDFYFYHSFSFKDKESFYKFERFRALTKGVLYHINFKYDEEFFLENYQDSSIIFPLLKRDNESILNYQLRNVKIALLYKKINRRIIPQIKAKAQNELDKKIIEWIKSPSMEAFAATQEIPLKTPTELRLLLKQNPKKIEISSLDFYKNL